eukprot:3844471-Heterocapsa_arctica.AAC.1
MSDGSKINILQVLVLARVDVSSRIKIANCCEHSLNYMVYGLSTLGTTMVQVRLGPTEKEW